MTNQSWWEHFPVIGFSICSSKGIPRTIDSYQFNPIAKKVLTTEKCIEQQKEESYWAGYAFMILLIKTRALLCRVHNYKINFWGVTIQRARIEVVSVGWWGLCLDSCKVGSKLPLLYRRKLHLFLSLSSPVIFYFYFWLWKDNKQNYMQLSCLSLGCLTIYSR
jgi:hypothetical protein